MAKPKQFNEEEALDKAMHLFWQKGYSGTSMQDLVEHTGLSRSSIYDTFDGKNQLFTRVLRKYMIKDTHTSDVLAQIKQGSLNSWTYLYNFVDALAQEAAEDPLKRGCLAVNTTAEVASCSQDIVALLQENQTTITDHLAQVIAVGQERGELNPALEAMGQARYLFMFINGLRLSARLDNTPDHLEAAVKAAMQGLLPVTV